MSRARLRAYSVWQLRDYLFERGLPLLVVCLLLTWLVWTDASGVRGRLDARELALDLWGALVPQLALFGTIIGTNGIVATDLRQGYFRFLFAKPLAAPAYYAQAFVVHAAGFAATMLVFLVALSGVLGVPVPLWGVGYALLHFVALGGIIFLASTASVSFFGRFDWLAAGALWAAGIAANALAARGKAWAGALRPFLPPSWRMDELLHAYLLGAQPPTEAMWHLGGYGAACFLLGLVVLRLRPLAA